MNSRVLRPDRLLVVAGIGALAWLLGDVLLLVFAGSLIAVALDGSIELFARLTRVSRGRALLSVIALLVAIAILGTQTIILPMIEQVRRVWAELPAAAERVTELLAAELGVRVELTGRMVLEEIVARIAPASMALVSVAIGTVVAIAVGVFVAIDPQLYRRGVVQLFPAARRERIGEVISRARRALRWWLVGQAFSMAILGVVTSTALWLLDIPLWLGLGVATALLTFIPYFGPLIAAVPILLLSFNQGIETGLIVLVVYAVLQNVEGFFLTPAIQQRAVRLPPALLISSQIAMAALFGALGLILAAPFTAFAMVAVKALYVEDVLGGPVEEPGRAA